VDSEKETELLVTPPCALERDLVEECRLAARAMGAFLAEVGQRRAKGSGTTLGFPDLVLLCAGEVRLIELKRTKLPGQPGGRLNVGQVAFIERAAEQRVKVHVVDTLEDFVEIVNSCRRGRAA
jgi:hypothetical protein